jgi:hypothetical protein
MKGKETEDVITKNVSQIESAGQNCRKLKMYSLKAKLYIGEFPHFLQVAAIDFLKVIQLLKLLIFNHLVV